MALRTIKNDACGELLTTIRKIIRAVDIHSKRLRLETGITGPQLIILKEIFHNEKITTTQLAANISLSQSTVTNILDRLVEKNLVVRIRGTIDRRVWFLQLTDSGISAVGKAPTLLQKEFIENFSSLPEWQQTQMLSTMQRIASMMYEQISDGSNSQKQSDSERA